MCPALHAVIWCWAIGQVTHTFITSEYAAIYVNLKFLLVFVLFMISYCCCCCVVYIITHGQQQETEQQQQQQQEWE